MESFEYYTPTKVHFGVDSEKNLVAELNKFGAKKVLIHYGGHSAIRSGLLDRIKKILDDGNISYCELGGVVPNPRLSKINEGIALSKKEGVDFILAVGGGSVIDSSKGIATGVYNGGDVWDFYSKKRASKGSVPVGVVLTIAAAGSEMSAGSVVTNEDGWLKRSYNTENLRPKFAILNPKTTLTLPNYQTASGCADIMMHIMERYFNLCENFEVVDGISESIMRGVMKNARILAINPNDLNASSEIMWSGSLAHNGLCGCGVNGGDWATHQMEHELGGEFDVAHGAGLCAMWSSWAHYVNDAAPARFVKFAVNVMGVDPEGLTDDEVINKGIEEVKSFYRDIKMPTNLHELGLDLTDEVLKKLSIKCSDNDSHTTGQVKKLMAEDIYKIYKAANK